MSAENETLGAGPPGPEAIEWLATRRCNLRCSHCAPSAGEAEPNELDRVEAFGLIDQVAALGAPIFAISGGELATRADWRDILAYALATLPRVHLVSNGWLVDTIGPVLGEIDHADRLLLVVSLDGPEAFHDARRGSDSFRRAVQLLCIEGPWEREVITTVARDNATGLEAVQDLVLDLSIPVWTVQPALPAGRLTSSAALDRAGLLRLAGTVRALRRWAGDRARIATSDSLEALIASGGASGWRGCPAGSRQMVVMPNGDVTGCVFRRDEPCGNVRETTLSDIWNGPAMADVRRRPRELGYPKGCLALHDRYGPEVWCAQRRELSR